MSHLWLRLLCALGLAVLGPWQLGCRAQTPSSAHANPGAGEQLLVQLSTTVDSNQGRPVYYMIRALPDQAGFSEGYDLALARALEEPVDASVLSRGLVQPQQSLVLTLPRSHDGELGVYVFFTQRDSAFKLLVAKPVPKSLVLQIDKNAVRIATQGAKR